MVSRGHPGSAGPQAPPPHRGTGEGRAGRTAAIALLFVVFWFILSGRIGLPYFIMMAVSIAIVLAINPDRPFPGGVLGQDEGLVGRARAGVALVRYVAWLVYNIAKANLEVAYLVLHPRMPIQPSLIRFRTQLKNEVAQVLVANSITLTPGTITIELEDGEYVVHSLHPRSAGSVTDGVLQNAVAPIFGEAAEPPPEVSWIHSTRELAR